MKRDQNCTRWLNKHLSTKGKSMLKDLLRQLQKRREEDEARELIEEM